MSLGDILCEGDVVGRCILASCLLRRLVDSNGEARALDAASFLGYFLCKLPNTNRSNDARCVLESLPITTLPLPSDSQILKHTILTSVISLYSKLPESPPEARPRVSNSPPRLLGRVLL